MQKKLVLAAAVAGAIAAPAAFAEATIYGHLDIGLQRVDPGAGYNGAEIFVTDQQGSGGSFVGWRDAEDLGGGLRGLAVVEVGLFTDTGELDNQSTIPAGGGTTSLKLAQRQIYAGLSGGFGTVTAGRQYREAFLVGAGGAYNYTAAAIGVFFLNPFTGVRQDNFIKYTTPSFSGLNVIVGYSPGEGTDATGADEESGKYTELAVKYSAGPLRVGVATGTSTADAAATPPADTDVMIAGGQYSFGPTTVYAIFSTSEADGNVIDESSISLGVKQTIGNGDVVLQAGQRKDDTTPNGDSTLIGVGYYHRLSKTTTVYTSYGMVDNDAGAGLEAPRQRADLTAAGEDPSTFSVGFRRTF